MNACATEATGLGKRILATERALDAAFAGGEIDRAALESALQVVGNLKARLRNVHLAAHLDQRALLGEDQVELYNRLRGYANRRGAHQGHH